MSETKVCSKCKVLVSFKLFLAGFDAKTAAMLSRMPRQACTRSHPTRRRPRPAFRPPAPRTKPRRHPLRSVPPSVRATHWTPHSTHRMVSSHHR